MIDFLGIALAALPATATVYGAQRSEISDIVDALHVVIEGVETGGVIVASVFDKGVTPRVFD